MAIGLVLPQFGLVGSGVLFTSDKNEERLAGVLAIVEGIDFAAYERNGIVHVVSRRGEATIENARRVSLSSNERHPLDLLSIIQQIANERNGADGVHQR